MKTQLHDNETVIRHGSANFQTTTGFIGGKLYATSHRVIFEPGKLNLSRKGFALDHDDIDVAFKAWTKWLGLVPMFPNSLGLKLKDGKTLRFVVFGRGKWVDAIDPPQRLATARVIERIR